MAQKVVVSSAWTSAERQALITAIRAKKEGLRAREPHWLILAAEHPGLHSEHLASSQLREYLVRQMKLSNLVAKVQSYQARFLEQNRVNFAEFLA